MCWTESHHDKGQGSSVQGPRLGKAALGQKNPQQDSSPPYPSWLCLLLLKGKDDYWSCGHEEAGRRMLCPKNCVSSVSLRRLTRNVWLPLGHLLIVTQWEVRRGAIYFLGLSPAFSPLWTLLIAWNDNRLRTKRRADGESRDDHMLPDVTEKLLGRCGTLAKASLRKHCCRLWKSQ